MARMRFLVFISNGQVERPDSFRDHRWERGRRRWIGKKAVGIAVIFSVIGSWPNHTDLVTRFTTLFTLLTALTEILTSFTMERLLNSTIRSFLLEGESTLKFLGMAMVGGTPLEALHWRHSSKEIGKRSQRV